MGWGGLPLVVCQTGGLGPSQTQRRVAFGSALTRPSALSSALDKVLSNWVFWSIFALPFLLELGIRIFLLGTVILIGTKLTDNLIWIAFFFFQTFNWVNSPKSSWSKALLESSLTDILHRAIAYISILSSKLVSKVVDFWRQGVNIFVDLVRCRFLDETGILHVWQCVGCNVWCPSAFTSLPCLKSFLLGSNGLFCVLIPPPGFMMPLLGPSCATHLLSCLEQACLDFVPYIPSGSICYNCRHTRMQVEDLLEMIAHPRVFKLPNF